MADTPQILGDKVRTLEDEFFRKEDQRFIQLRRDLQEKAVSREALAKVSGIKNEAILDKLLQLGIRAEVLAALALVPLVEVAWADGSLDDRERREILARAEKSGVAPGSPGLALLQSWLERKPEPKLLTAWIQMVAGLSEHMTPEQVQALRAGLVERARAIASASGGLLGVGKVSAAEADMIQQLESAFART
jgi:hypothetical protein